MPVPDSTEFTEFYRGIEIRANGMAALEEAKRKRIDIGQRGCWRQLDLRSAPKFCARSMKCEHGNGRNGERRLKSMAVALSILATLTVSVTSYRNRKEGSAMKCAVCEREFEPKRKTAKFCSDRCRIRNHRPNWYEKYNKLVDEHNALVAEFNAFQDKAVETNSYIERLELDREIANANAASLAATLGDDKKEFLSDAR